MNSETNNNFVCAPAAAEAKTVRLYILDISTREFDVSKISLLEEKRRDEILTGKNYLYNLRSLYAGLLLRHAFIKEGFAVSGPLEVEYNEHGKPSVRGYPHFSITHSGNLVIIGVADFPVGIDAEIKQNKVYSHIADKVFSPRELGEYSLLEGKDMSDYFLSHWVVKEGYLKLIGTGLNGYPKDVDVSADVNGMNYTVERLEYRNYTYFLAAVSKERTVMEKNFVSALRIN